MHALRVSKSLANFHFWSNYPFRDVCPTLHTGKHRAGESETLSTNDQKSDSNSGRQKRTNQPINRRPGFDKEYSNIEKLHYN